MKLINRLVLPGITVAMLGLATSAVAQWGDSYGGGQGMSRDSGRMEQMRDKRQQALHDKLKLSAEQEKAWRTFVATGKELRPKNRPGPLDFAGLTAPQRMEKMLDRMRDREARMTKMLGALKTFYAVLTPQQQRILDDSMQRMGGHHRMRQN
jgi:periplasmic protein CpxP/Spy